MAAVHVDINKYVPEYTPLTRSHLENGEVLKVFKELIEETAYHVLKVGDFDSKDQYSDLGRILYHKYPCIGFSTGSQPG